MNSITELKNEEVLCVAGGESPLTTDGFIIMMTGYCICMSCINNNVPVRKVFGIILFASGFVFFSLGAYFDVTCTKNK